MSHFRLRFPRVLMLQAAALLVAAIVLTPLAPASAAGVSDDPGKTAPGIIQFRLNTATVQQFLRHGVLVYTRRPGFTLPGRDGVDYGFVGVGSTGIGTYRVDMTGTLVFKRLSTGATVAFTPSYVNARGLSYAGRAASGPPENNIIWSVDYSKGVTSLRVINAYWLNEALGTQVLTDGTISGTLDFSLMPPAKPDCTCDLPGTQTG